MKEIYFFARNPFPRLYRWPKLLAVFMIFLIGQIGFAQCNYTLELSDSWGDGWNGGKISVFVNGVVVLEDHTLSGSYTSYDFPVETGDDVTTTYTPGNYSYENGYRILDANGNVVFTSNYDEDDGPPVSVSSGQITAECPACPAPTGFLSGTTHNSATIGWTSSGTDFEVNWGTGTFAAGEGANTQTVTGTSYSFPNNLLPTTTYRWFIRQNCGGNGMSTWAGPYTFTTSVTPTTAPWNEGFATTSTPAGWTTTGWTINTHARVPSLDGNHIHKNLYNSFPTGTFTTINVEGVSTGDVLSFDYILTDWTNHPEPPPANSVSIAINISVNGGAFDPLATITDATAPTGWQYFQQDLSAYAGQNIKIQVVATWVADDFVLAFDNFFIGAPPSCIAPTSLTATNPTANSAELGWTSDGSSFDIKWGLTGFDVETEGTLVENFTNGGTLSGLSSQTAYQFYVRQDCGLDGLSLWAGPLEFTTLCDPATSGFSQNFDSGSAGSSTNPNLTDCWSFIDTGAGSGYVYNFSSPYSAPNHFYITNSSDNSGDYILVSPPTDNLGNGAYWVKFYAKAGVANYSLEFGTLSDGTDAATFTVLETISLTTTYQEYIVLLPAGTDDYFGFRHGLGGTFRSIYIDDIVYEEAPSCFSPTAASLVIADGFTAEFSWEAAAGDNIEEYNWVVIADGEDPDTATPVVSGNTTDTSVTATGLSPETAYDFYVRTNCGSEDGNSTWATKVDFSTTVACPAPTAGVSSVVTLTSAKLDWTSAGTDFEINWGTGTFDAGEGTNTETVSGTSFTFPNNLSHSTTYRWFVRQDCGANGTSTWAGPYTFTTATPGQIGSGSGTSSYFPIYTWYAYNYSQQIYLASELQAVLETGDTYITKIRFRKNAGTGTAGNFNNWTVYMANTSKSTFSNTSDWVAHSELSTVFTGTVNISPNGSWTEITLDTPFLWDGTSNLVVAVDENSPGIGTNADNWTAFNSGSNRGIVVYRDGSDIDPANPNSGSPYSNGPSATIAQIQIEATAPPACFPPNSTFLIAVDGFSAQFYWETTGGDNIEGYNWVIIADGEDPDTATPVASGNTTDTFIIATGLSPETAYDFYVRTDCGTEDGESVWSTKLDFSTTEACPAPTGLTHMQLSTTSAELSWTSDGTLFEIKWGTTAFDPETEGSLITGIEGTSYELSGLTADTSYRFYVRRDCTDTNNGNSSWAGPYTFSVGYCTPTAGSSDNTGITNVTFNTINYSTTGAVNNAGAYKNYTDISTEVQAGLSYDLGVRVNTDGASYRVHVRAWIDWNNDGVFDTATEEYMLGSVQGVSDGATDGSPLSIEIPVTAALGEYRMRVRATFGTTAVPTPCGQQNYSETEDYTIKVTEGPVTWTGTEWINGTPAPEVSVLVDGPLSPDAIEVNSLYVSENGSVNIAGGNSITVNGKITNDAGVVNFVVSNEANLIQTSDAANTGAITVIRESQDMVRLDYTMWSSPVAGQNLFGFSPMTVNGVTNHVGSEGRIYIYDGANGYVNPDPFTETTSMNGAVGYLFRAPNNWSSTVPAPYVGSFTGVPNNGNINVATHAENYTSIGNPYPSNITVNTLYAANPDINALYLWNNNHSTGNNYATCTNGVGCAAAAGGGNTPNGVITVGQGFIVHTTATSVAFNNAMRVENGGIFFKVDELESHRFWLNLNGENEESYNQILVGYVSEATNSIDQQIDGKLFGYQGSALYNLIEEEAFVIQGRALPFEASDVVPLGFKAAESGKFKISLANFDGLFAEGAVSIYLKDNQLNIAHNLMESDYEFESAQGEFKERFEVIYETEGTMGTGDFDSSLVQIYQHNNQIVVSSKTEKILSVELFDLQGRNIHRNAKVNAHVYQIESASFGTQVLVVKVQTQNGEVVTKKVINK